MTWGAREKLKFISTPIDAARVECIRKRQVAL